MPSYPASELTAEIETALPNPRPAAIDAGAADRLSGGLYARLGKRALDVAFGGALLLLALPAVVLLAACLLATSGWPPFYAARRVGKGGREFRRWKLRTMAHDADRRLAVWRSTHPELACAYEANFKLTADPRVTRLGRLLRRFSLDELPQLWNVVRGEMSLVGPRPVTAREVALYGARAPLLLAAAPGMTGRWQVSGRTGVTYPARIELELSYCDGVSLAGDLAILARTLRAVVGAGGY